MLLALSAGRRWLAAAIPAREREVRRLAAAPNPTQAATLCTQAATLCTQAATLYTQVFGTSLLLYLVFGMLQAAIPNP